MDAENDLPSPDDEGELVPRQPSVEDLMELCCELNARGARYVVVGGFAIRASGYVRETMDIDLLVATDLENEARVFKSLTERGSAIRSRFARSADRLVARARFGPQRVDGQRRLE